MLSTAVVSWKFSPQGQGKCYLTKLLVHQDRHIQCEHIFRFGCLGCSIVDSSSSNNTCTQKLHRLVYRNVCMCIYADEVHKIWNIIAIELQKELCANLKRNMQLNGYLHDAWCCVNKLVRNVIASIIKKTMAHNFFSFSIRSKQSGQLRAQMLPRSILATLFCMWCNTHYPDMPLWWDIQIKPPDSLHLGMWMAWYETRKIVPIGGVLYSTYTVT